MYNIFVYIMHLYPLRENLSITEKSDPWNNDLFSDPYNGEPPPYSSKQSNNCVLTLDTRSDETDFNPSNDVITNSNNKTSVILNNRARKFAMTYFRYYRTIPNVNERNNTFNIVYDGIIYNITIPIGFYRVNITDTSILDPLPFKGLVTEIVAALNGQTPGIFNISIGDSHLGGGIYGGDLFYEIEGDKLWYFVLGDDLKRLKWLFNPDQSQTAALKHNIGPVSRVYTRYFKIRSNTLARDLKLMNIDTRFGNEPSLTTIWLTPYSIDESPGKLLSFQFNTPVWKNLRKDAGISSIDITLLDEWGDEFYVGTTKLNDDTPNAFNWSAEITMEL